MAEAVVVTRDTVSESEVVYVLSCFTGLVSGFDYSGGSRSRGLKWPWWFQLGLHRVLSYRTSISVLLGRWRVECLPLWLIRARDRTLSLLVCFGHKGIVSAYRSLLRSTSMGLTTTWEAWVGVATWPARRLTHEFALHSSFLITLVGLSAINWLLLWVLKHYLTVGCQHLAHTYLTT